MVFRDVSLTILEDEFVSVVGPSGCGKTTLLSIIAGLLRPTAGRVLVDGVPISGPGRERGVVFQQDAIFPWRKVVDNVRYGLQMRGLEKEKQAVISRHFIRLVGLEGFSEFYPKELSGGMKKRVAIAMVFANDPAVYLMDEPFGSLDYATKVGLQNQLLAIWGEKKRTAVFVTHDLEEAVFLSDRIVVLANQDVAEILEIPFARPRTDEIRTDPLCQEIKRKLWKYLS